MVKQITRVIETINPEPEFVDEPPKTAYVKKKAIFRFYQIIWYVLAVIEILLIFRFLLRALGANPSSSFVSFVYDLSDPLALPFTVFGAVVYLIIAYGLVELFQFFKPVSSEEVEDAVDKSSS